MNFMNKMFNLFKIAIQKIKEKKNIKLFLIYFSVKGKINRKYKIQIMDKNKNIKKLKFQNDF